MTDDSRREAKQRADEFYAGLCHRIRRYNPEEFGPAVARIIYNVLDTPRMWRYYEPHYLVHAIEANCAYYQSLLTTEKVTQPCINRIINYYKGYRDPYIEYVLDKLRSLEYLVLAMARQQFPYQRAPRASELARSILLFVDKEPLPQTAARFQATYGLTTRDWVYMSFAVLADTWGRNSPVTSPRHFLASEVGALPKTAVEPFMRASSLPPEAISDRYHSLRQQYPSYLHIFLPSVFIDYPLVDYGNDMYLAVHPSLMFDHGLFGLHRACEEVDEQSFHKEFGKSFQRYVGKVLSQLKGAYRVISEAQIMKISPGRTCDYVVVCEGCIVLVECKGIRYSATLLTEGAIKGDNSTTKLGESFEQLQHTARRIRAGEMDALFDSRGKTLFGFTVTFGEVYFADSPRYITEFIMPNVHLPEGGRWPAPLNRVPQIISIGTLEDTVAVVNATGTSLSALVEAKLSEEYSRVGDWRTYLLNKYKGQAIDWDLPLLVQAVARFFPYAAKAAA
jgi:hypothetical protein